MKKTGKRSIRKNFSLTKEMDKDISVIARACNLSDSTLIYTVLQNVMYHEVFITNFQETRCIHQALKAYLTIEHGRLKLE